MITLCVGDRPVVECRPVKAGAPITHTSRGSEHYWHQAGQLLATWMERD